MKIWEIKAQALRLMFTVSDMNLNETDFSSGIIRQNQNTAEKLIRMDDSIRRGIDLYYSYVGEPISFFDTVLVSGNNSDEKVVDFNYVNAAYPTRVDIFVYDTDGNKIGSSLNVTFRYDQILKKIFFDTDYGKYETDYGYTVKPKVWYRVVKKNLPIGANEMTYDLDAIDIPEEVQRMLPYFIKGEIYEEDEFNVAQSAKNEYIRFLLSLRKPFSNVQTKVRKSKIFSK